MFEEFRVQDLGVQGLGFERFPKYNGTGLGFRISVFCCDLGSNVDRRPSEQFSEQYMGGCQNYGQSWVP